MAIPHVLAAQLYSVRDQCQTPAAALATLRQLREHGYRKVQISGPIDRYPAAEVAAMCAAAGVTIIGHHLSLHTLRTEFREVVSKLQAWGCQYTAVAYLPPEERADAAAYVARGRELNDFGKRLKAEGITLQYHNHAFEMQKFAGRTGLEILFAESDPDYVQAEIDTCWIARGGANPADWVRKMKGRMDQVHLKDTVIQDDTPVFAEIGNGNINWQSVLAACREIGVRDYIVEQDACPATHDPVQSLGLSYRFLAGQGLA